MDVSVEGGRVVFVNQLVLSEVTMELCEMFLNVSHQGKYEEF